MNRIAPFFLADAEDAEYLRAKRRQRQLIAALESIEETAADGNGNVVESIVPSVEEIASGDAKIHWLLREFESRMPIDELETVDDIDAVRDAIADKVRAFAARLVEAAARLEGGVR